MDSAEPSSQGASNPQTDWRHPKTAHSAGQRTAWVAAAYAALAVAFTWPLGLRLTTHVIGPWRGDNFEYVWKMWWVAEALFNRRVSPFFHPEIYYPTGYNLAYGEITPAHTFLLAPLTRWLGEVTAYNLAVLLSVWLSGLAGFWLARRWLRDLAGDRGRLLTGAAFFAGAVFAVCGYRMVRIAGHLPLIDTHWLALALLGLDRWLDTRRLREAALTGLMIALAALSSWYYGLMLAMLLPVYVLARGREVWAWRADRRTWGGAALAAGLALALCAPFLRPYLELARDGEAAVPLREASFWAASPLDYLMPNPRHPLWGEAVQAIMWPVPGHEMPAEFVNSLGWITLVFGLWSWRQVHGPRWRGLKWIVIAAFILSLGPHLHLGRVSLGIPLPALALRDLLPAADGVRSWGRFAVFVMLGFSVLAGAGLLLWLRDKPSRDRRVWGAAALIAALAAAWIGPARLVRVEPRPVDRWLAAQPDGAAIMQYPLDEALSGPAMLYTRYHGKPVVFGYGTYLPLLFRERHPELAEFPMNTALDRLAEWGVRYILITVPALERAPDGERFTLADVEAQPRLRYITTLGNEAVYELADSSS